MKRVPRGPFLITLAAALSAALPAQAQDGNALRDAVQAAISTNPEVTQRFNALRGAGHDADAARGALRPRLDLQADVGRTQDTYDNRAPSGQSLTKTGVGLTVTQLLWDGPGTQRDITRAQQFRVVRWHEFIEASEQAALEAARAHYDVLRFRQLLELADENYVMHRIFTDQIQSRVKAGVARGVDLEQVMARLALAESNRVVEVANLHDVSARYRRVVGAVPPAATTLGNTLDTTLAAGLPGDAADNLRQATDRNAGVAAAVANLRAARAQAESQGSAFVPKVQVRAGLSAGHNLNGSLDQRRNGSAELLLNWNLYNGGTDTARSASLAAALGQAADSRDRVCRDVAQTAAIAFNDIAKLNAQLGLLQRNVSAVTRARDAYRQQFEIGQRSLLDLLNTENELYTAKRTLVNAEHDLGIAQARTHAAANTLIGTLGLSRIDGDAAGPEATAAGEDAALRCPLADVAPVASTLAELDARAREQAASRGGLKKP